jgi:hypothetical protein
MMLMPFCHFAVWPVPKNLASRYHQGYSANFLNEEKEMIRLSSNRER